MAELEFISMYFTCMNIMLAPLSCEKTSKATPQQVGNLQLHKSYSRCNKQQWIEEAFYGLINVPSKELLQKQK